MQHVGGTGIPQGGTADHGSAGGAPAQGAARSEEGGGGTGASSGEASGNGTAGTGEPTDSPSFVGPSWRDGLVPVCWLGDLEPDVQLHVQDLVRANWGRSSRLLLYNWTPCGSDTAGWLKIRQEDSEAGSIDGNGAAPGGRSMVLGIRLDDASILHLFGHALGFDHPGVHVLGSMHSPSCDAASTDYPMESPWSRSIMKMAAKCSRVNLGPWDIREVRRAYGRKARGSLVHDSGLCVDIPDDAPDRWVDLQLYECTGARNQRWKWAKEGQFFPPHAEFLAVDVAAPGYVQLYSLNQPVSSNQAWSLSDGELRGFGDGCLSAVEDGNDRRVALAAECTPSTSQGWEMTRGGLLRHGEQCLSDVAGSNELSLTSCDDGGVLRFEARPNGQLASGERCLAADTSDLAIADVPMRLLPCLNSDAPTLPAQQFYFHGRVNNAGSCLRPYLSYAENNATLEVYGCSPGTSQWWAYYLDE
jgi:hypothetical protein